MRRTPLILLPTSAILLLLLGLVTACPSGGELDDDDVVDDDDDDDDDDDGADDDDDDTPEGVAMSGELRYQPNDGPVPAGAIRVGLFSITDAFAVGDEQWSAQVTKGDLLSGATVFTVFVDAAPAGLTTVEDDTSMAMYVPFAYGDADGDEAFGGNDGLLGSSTMFLAFIEDTDGKLPKDLVSAGAGAGWNTLEYDFFGDDGITFAHVPVGTNSNNGPELRSKIIPTPGGDVPLRTNDEVPVMSNVAAFLAEGGSAPPSAQLFRQAVDNTAGANPFSQWTIGGNVPPPDHVGDLSFGAGDDDDSAGDDDDGGGPSAPSLTGAIYDVTAWWDGEQDGETTGDCDLILGAPNKTLGWVAPPGTDLDAAFWMHLNSLRPGWLLLEGDLPRLLASGVDFDDGVPGDDDDSAAGAVLDQLPAECVPQGDDDDSAGDDDDSAGDDDDSAGDDDDSAP
ncbi:MAG: hypothetical protein KDA24_24040 [Deltaproteobacteria bacterium]|nr:hypothetical protein [Deltaproteobacteria bacterium]